MWFNGMEDLVEREERGEITMQKEEVKLQCIYAIRNKRTREIINRKAKVSIPFYCRKGMAEKKIYSGDEEVVTYELKEVIT